MFAKITCNISSGHCGVCLQVIKPFFLILVIFPAQKVSLKTSFELRKSPKRMPSLADTEINQTKQ